MRVLFTSVFVLLVTAGVANAQDLRIDIEPVAGFGATRDEVFKNGTFNINAGVTLLTIDKNKHIGFVGVGVVGDLYDYASHSAEIRDQSRLTSGFGFFGGMLPTTFVSVIPIRIGPFTYQFSLSKHIKSHGLDRGRLHIFTFDIIGWIRLSRVPEN